MHSHQYQHFNRIFAITVFSNIAYVIVQIFYGLYADSLGLISDAIHNLGDVLGIGGAWFAHWLLQKAPSSKFSFGYKKTTVLAALNNSLLLILSAVFIIYEAMETFLHPSPTNGLIVIFVALGGVIVNGATAMLFFKNQKEDINIRASFIHLLSDALISLAVVISGVIIYYTGAEWVDPILAIFIGLVIIKGGIPLLKESFHSAIDGVPTQINLDAIRNYFLSLEGVSSLHDLHIWPLSTRENALSVHLIVNQISIFNHKKIAKKLETQFKIHHTTIQLESAGQAKNCSQKNCGHCTKS